MNQADFVERNGVNVNAKQIAKMIRRDAERLEASGEKASPTMIHDIAGLVESLIPKYRPPQPNDDGKWCFLDQSNAPEEPMQLKCRGGTRWEAWDAEDEKYIPVTGNVWPSERP